MKQKQEEYLEQFYKLVGPVTVYSTDQQIHITVKNKLWAGVEHYVYTVFETQAGVFSEVVAFNFTTNQPHEDKYIEITLEGTSPPSDQTLIDAKYSVSVSTEFPNEQLKAKGFKKNSRRM
jgi:hypothetical protein